MSANKSFSTETSERYSRALYEVLKETNELDKAEKDIKSFQLIIESSPDVKNFIKDQIIPTELGNTFGSTKGMLENFDLGDNKKFFSLENILSGP